MNYYVTVRDKASAADNAASAFQSATEASLRGIPYFTNLISLQVTGATHLTSPPPTAATTEETTQAEAETEETEAQGETTEASATTREAAAATTTEAAAATTTVPMTTVLASTTTVTTASPTATPTSVAPLNDNEIPGATLKFSVTFNEDYNSDYADKNSSAYKTKAKESEDKVSVSFYALCQYTYCTVGC